MPEDYAARFSKGQNPELRLMKKLEHCANARSESTAIIASRLAEREQARLSLRKTDEVASCPNISSKAWSRIKREPSSTSSAVDYTMFSHWSLLSFNFEDLRHIDEIAPGLPRSPGIQSSFRGRAVGQKAFQKPLPDRVPNPTLSVFESRREILSYAGPHDPAG